jgi:hypothetical protein
VKPPLWVAIDFGVDHQVQRTRLRPPGLEWHGPFSTWGQAKRFICSAGAAEAKAIHDKNGWWRSARLVDVLEGESDE